VRALVVGSVLLAADAGDRLRERHDVGRLFEAEAIVELGVGQAVIDGLLVPF
jgi:hypothetical protein